MTQGELLNFERKIYFPQDEEIEIYHDEVFDGKNRPFGHQFLAVPCRSRDILHNLLTDTRNRHNTLDGTITWKKIRKNEKKDIGKKNTLKEWLMILCNSMYMGRFSWLLSDSSVQNHSYLGIKVSSVFVERLDDISDDFWPHWNSASQLRKKKYEAILAMGVKSMLHYCFNPEYINLYHRNLKVKVKKFFTDGEFGAFPIRRDKVMEKLSSETRDYIDVPYELDITPVPKSNNKDDFKVNLEELTDSILGSTCYLAINKEGSMDNHIEPLKNVYKKIERKSGFLNSGHFRTFTVSKAILDDEGVIREWKNLNVQDKEIEDRVLKLDF